MCVYRFAGFFLFLTIALGAQAQEPMVSLSTTSLAFGSQLVETSSQAQIVTLTNTGSGNLNITKVSAGPNYAVFSDCGSVVLAGANCTLGVLFVPTTTGALAGRITIQDNADDSPQKISLTGTSLAVGVGLSPNVINFGTLASGTTSAPMSVTVANQSSAAVTFGSVAASGPYAISNNNCTGTLGAGANCAISVTFSPTAGTTNGTLTISDSDPSSPQIVGLTGTGSAGNVGLSPTSLTFSSQAIGTVSAPQSVTVTNNGSANLAIVTVDASGDFAQTNNCPASLAPGANCTLTVTFSPSGTNTRTGYVTLNDTDPTNLQTVNLTGTGVANSVGNLTVTPVLSSVTFTQSQQYQAYVNGSPTSKATWSVDGMTGGNSTVGTVSTSGLYTPPLAAGNHSITATSTVKSSYYYTVPIVVTDFTGVLTYHNDNARTGQNLDERLLTTGNVNTHQFGKLFTLPVDGKIYGQPLYVPSLQIPSQGVHNVLYVVTENDSVFAFDADSSQATPLWMVNFTDPDGGITTVPADEVETTCNSIEPQVGINPTPVIDTTTGTIYVIARIKQVQNGVTSYAQYLHALNIQTGQEQSGSPVQIQASVPGYGEGSVGGTVAFDPFYENSRPAMLLSNGVVYAAWSSMCDTPPYHGWVLGYDASSLAQVSIFNSTPNGEEGGIWQSQAGLAADASGNIYFMTSNGLYDVDNGGQSYGNAFVKLASDGMTVEDFFAPYNTLSLTVADLDLSAGGPLLLPDQTVGPAHLLVGAGKEGTIYLLNRDNMGHFNPGNDNQIVQVLYHAVGIDKGPVQPFYGKPGYFGSHVYFWGSNDVLRDFRFYQGMLSQAPIATSGKITVAYPGPVPTVSANGTANAIVWALQQNNAASVLRAFDAANVSRELYDSNQNTRRDNPGGATRFLPPTIANGKVYVGTTTAVSVYGVLP